MKLVLLVFTHPPARDDSTDARDAAQPLLFYGRLALTFALWRSCVIAESQDHKSGWGYFCRRQTRTLTLPLGRAVWAPMAGECSGSASDPPECNAVCIRDSSKYTTGSHCPSPSWLRRNLSRLFLGMSLFETETKATNMMVLYLGLLAHHLCNRQSFIW